MNLKNFTAFNLSRNLIIEDLGELNKALASITFREMGSQESQLTGFVPPMDRYRPGAYAVVVGPRDLEFHTDPEEYDAELDNPEVAFTDAPYPMINDGTDSLLLKFFIQKKIIVADDLKRRVEARVEEIENSQHRKVYKSERGEIKDAILATIMPYAQSRRTFIDIAITPRGLVLVGACGAAAETAISALRAVLGTLPVRPIALLVDRDPVEVLTMIARAQGEDDLVSDFSPNGFTITDDYQVQAAGDMPEIARCKNTDISQEAIQDFIREGKVVTHASLNWLDKVMFKTNNKLQFRGVRIDHATYAEGAGSEELDLATASYSETLIELQTLRDMLETLIELHGGLSTGDEDASDQWIHGFWDNLHGSID